MLHKRNHISKESQSVRIKGKYPRKPELYHILEQRQYETEFGRAAQNP
jgi:hypothetical protein